MDFLSCERARVVDESFLPPSGKKVPLPVPDERLKLLIEDVTTA